MSNTIKYLERLATGVPGLDRLLEGGFLVGGVYIVQGLPGAGKTILANQICFNHVRNGGHAVYITLLAESHGRMLQHMQRMEFYDPKLIGDRLYYLSAFKVLEDDGLGGLLDTLRRAVSARRATLLVLDGLVSAEEASPTPRDYKKFIHELQVVLAMIGATALLLSNSERARPFRPDHTMVDGIIEISNELRSVRSLRQIQVRKMRGADQISGQHTLQISNAGIAIHPRLETIIDPLGENDVPPPPGERYGFGIRALDAMLGGGLPAASGTMLLGPTGAGKTLLGLQWLAAGAQLGQAGLYFGFYERPLTILEKASRLGIALAEPVARGLIRQMWQRPVEGVLDLVAHRLLDEVRRARVDRLFIDGVDGFETAIDSDNRVRDIFAALADELEREGVTICFTVEAQQLIGTNVAVPFRGVSTMTHNIVIVRHHEAHGKTRRVISILKMRDSGYDQSLRELLITSEGLQIGEIVDFVEPTGG